MKIFCKTYRLENFRIYVRISSTTDRLTIYTYRDGRRGSRIKYEWYFSRKEIIKSMLKDMLDVNIPSETIHEVLNDVKRNLN